MIPSTLNTEYALSFTLNLSLQNYDEYQRLFKKKSNFSGKNYNKMLLILFSKIVSIEILCDVWLIVHFINVLNTERARKKYVATYKLPDRFALTFLVLPCF